MGKLTKGQFKKGIPALIENLQKKKPGKRKKSDRKKQACKDFWFFWNEYLTHYKEQESPEFHKEIIDLLESQGRFTAVAAPRGFAKSTLVSFAFVLWQIISQKCGFILLVSATDALAKDLAKFVRLELEDNSKIIEDFGSSCAGKDGDFTAFGCRVLALGRSRAVRGFRHRQYRPDLIILDDIEKDGEALSYKITRKILDTIKRGLIPSLGPKGRVVIIGTVIRLKSAAGTIMLSDEEPWALWKRKIYRALSDRGESLWEERFSSSSLEEIKTNIGTAAFNAEFQNRPSEEEHSLFTKEMFRDGKDDGISPMVLFIDPSPDSLDGGDYKAAVLVEKGINAYIIAGIVLTRGRDSIFFEALINLYLRFRHRIATVAGENNHFQGYFLKDLSKAAQERGVYIPISGIRTVLNKQYRIARLASWFETGRLLFGEGLKETTEGKILIEQLLYFPSASINDDGPDALAGALALLEADTTESRISFLPRPDKFRRSFIR